MFFTRFAIAAILLVFLDNFAVADDAMLAPRTGLLLLRNGELLDGEITRAGDFFVVTRGTGIEIRMNAADVDFFCRSASEAYERKAAAVRPGDKASVLALAQWCLRHQLYSECDAQLAAAATLVNDTDPAIEALRSRLQIAREVPAPATIAAPVSLANVPIEKIEQRLETLPPGTIEKFTSIVQPVLLNRCGANQCHGPNSRNEFQLYRPPAGQLATRRFTQRNLYAVLLQLDATRPLESPLLLKASEAHGDLPGPVFDKRSLSQLEEIVHWTMAALATNDPAATAAPDAANGDEPAPTGVVDPTTGMMFDPRVQRGPRSPLGATLPPPPADAMQGATDSTTDVELPATTTVKRPATIARGSIKNPPALLDVPEKPGEGPSEVPEEKRSIMSFVEQAAFEKAAAPPRLPQTPPTKAAPPQRDPFDPAWFNERFHGSKR